jgi:hypothetical protein
MISIITPSIRKSGLEIVQKALRRQTFTDYEWLVGSPEDYGFGTWVKDPGKAEGDYWSIFKTYNALIKKAQGELVVSWQDHTFADPDCLEKFWLHYQTEPKTVVTAVGNKYKDDTWTAKTWQDPRERSDQGSYYGCNWNDIELNLASFPMQGLIDVGGFDEDMDKYSSFCGLDVLHRLACTKEYDFKIDQTIKSYSTEHGRPPLWEESIPRGGIYGDRVKYLMSINQWPKLKYLEDKI